jgi:hypothetical protein
MIVQILSLAYSATALVSKFSSKVYTLCSPDTSTSAALRRGISRLRDYQGGAGWFRESKFHSPSNEIRV